MGIWQYGLDPIFTFITNFWSALFNAIPAIGVQFMIGILCYSFMFFLEWKIIKTEASRQRFGVKIIYYVWSIFMILFTLWRFGVIVLIEDKAIAETATAYILNVLYMLVAVIMIVAFTKNVPWLKKFLISFLWLCFLLFTLLICPITGDSVLSNETFIQVGEIALVFIIPGSMLEYQKAKNSGV